MTDRAAEQLRERSLRVTQPRLAVLDALDRLPHADAHALHAALADSGSDISLQSVHNVLGDLADAGLARRFEPARSAARYERLLDWLNDDFRLFRPVEAVGAPEGPTDRNPHDQGDEAHPPHRGTHGIAAPEDS